MSAAYETIIVLNTKLDEEATKAMVEKFTSLIAANGTIDSVEEWGKRKLAYEIEDETEGYYVLINFTSATEFTKELDRIYQITDGVLRTIIVRKNA
ncbi:MAG: 30S ribosomal protein S6 [Oscillospiraceae bacterium]